MRFNAERVRRNVREATTEDLLDRVTTYREGMEPEALEIIDAELRARGIARDAIKGHAEQQSQQTIDRADGIPATCSFCPRPASQSGWGWHRLWGLLPVFPRFLSYCPNTSQGKETWTRPK